MPLTMLKGILIKRNASAEELDLVHRAIRLNEQLAQAKTVKDTATWFIISEAEVTNTNTSYP